LPHTKRFGIAGEVIPPGFALTGSLPSNRANFSLFYDGPADTWLAGLDAGGVVHYTGQYEDDNASLSSAFGLLPFPKPQTPRSGLLPWRARKVREWITLDLITSYTFNLPPLTQAEVPGFAKDGGKNVKIKDGKGKAVISTAEYNPCRWRAWLNNTTISLGMQNVFDNDPPFVGGAFENGYDESLATIKGRFWYVQVKKRF
jgi:outer membrane receptor protein involved in Fe transport